MNNRPVLLATIFLPRESPPVKITQSAASSINGERKAEMKNTLAKGGCCRALPLRLSTAKAEDAPATDYPAGSCGSAGRPPATITISTCGIAGTWTPARRTTPIRELRLNAPVS